ncbi:cytochrome c oxidase assembly protein [Paraferrimonas sedimenticola]|uniref:Cytochrome c oxidase assembly protein CtaG n=1 Tax=Paraferrimonas sedimenticola TaxID=375674 RepID=A0AA37RWB0_9GAMM|nr:cytochrome c oxidase assembly protein [Paraferrimonas sedimenticola]GLP95957.1 cytochrome c oxidase assembly protein [Paraferrimonas sedimenticola]
MTELTQTKHKKLTVSLLLVALGMFGFGFALVPLYEVFCEWTGINGKTSTEAAVYQAGEVDTSRLVNVEFIAHVSPGMPWDFAPKVKRMTVHPGELKQVAFEVTSQSGDITLGQAIPSVSPGTAALYLNKTECFCFNQQQLAAGGTADLPLVFFVDPQLPKDIETLTLSYTLYNISDQLTAQVANGAHYD